MVEIAASPILSESEEIKKNRKYHNDSSIAFSRYKENSPT